MEYAIRIISPDQGVLVSITQMLELGEDETRNSDYICPDENCGVPVFPAIPEKEKPGRIFAPRPYFRAGKAHPHIPGCLGDSGVQVEETKTPTDKKKIVKTTSDAVLSDHPVRFDERRPSVDGDGGNGGVGDGGPPTTRGGRGSGEGGGRQHTSKRSTRQVCELVRAYEATLHAEHAGMSLSIQKCPARNFEEAFRSVRQAIDRQGRPFARRIYYGRYDRHTEYHSDDIAIFFAERAADRKPFSVWVKAELGPATVRQNLLERLRQARDGTEAVVYVLGEFHPHQGYKYTVEIPGLNYVCVSLHSSQQP